MTPAAAMFTAQMGLALALLFVGAAVAWSAANAIKRVVALELASVGALIGMAALGAPAGLLVVAVGAGFALLLLGLALAVRLQEAYGGVETPDIDRADAEDDAAAERNA